MSAPQAETVARLLDADRVAFERLVARAQEALERTRYAVAVGYAHSAAIHAVWRHPGFFVSPELENVLLSIGRRAIPVHRRSDRPPPVPGSPLSVVHVFTQVSGVGGHTRMVWRWIQQDATRSHSVVITRQGALRVPRALSAAVSAAGGGVYVLNERPGNVLSWAAQLRRIASHADIVVLHTNPDDVIPTLAFADRRQRPPIVLLDHADHVFWLGRAISDVVAALRVSGLHLARERRGIEAERSMLLPIILQPMPRTLTRSEAKQRLGLDPDRILLLSVARALKYRSTAGVSFADRFVPILERYPQAVLWAVGPPDSDEWARASQRIGGRIRAFGQREDTPGFYQAADIYVDSFPFTSSTSLLEAGSYGLPLLSRCAYPSEAAVLCADAPGMDGHLITSRDETGYDVELSRLIEDEQFRSRLGQATAESIAAHHTGAAWQSALENVYARALTLPPLPETLAAPKLGPVSQLDLRWSDVFRTEVGLVDALELPIRSLPLTSRWPAVWRLMLARRRLRLGLIPPEWFVVRVQELLARRAEHSHPSNESRPLHSQ